MQRLFVSVRGPREALEAVKGGASGDGDVLAVRRAACEEKGYGRFGTVKDYLVRRLAATIPVRETATTKTT